MFLLQLFSYVSTFSCDFLIQFQRLPEGVWSSVNVEGWTANGDKHACLRFLWYVPKELPSGTALLFRVDGKMGGGGGNEKDPF